MKDADLTRDHWASLLSGGGPLSATPFADWLRVATSLMSIDGGSGTPGVTGFFGGGPGGTVDWARLMEPWMSGWSGITDKLDGSAFGWIKPGAKNPMAQILNHPAAVAGGGDSKAELSMHAMQAYADLVKSATSHQALQMQGWLSAMQRFAAKFSPAGDDQSPAVVIKTFDDLLTHWGNIGEAALQQHSRTEGFLESQAELLRKDMHYRIARRRVMESAARANDMPTLTDMDEAFASIHELRKEIRAVRQIAEGAAAMSAAASGAPSFKAERKALAEPVATPKVPKVKAVAAPETPPKATSESTPRRARRAAA